MKTDHATPAGALARDDRQSVAIKLAYVVCNDVLVPSLMDVLERCGIDYYTRWDRTKGKGHGTAPHLGARGMWSTNAVLMIAFIDSGPLERLVAEIRAFNAAQPRPDDQMRLFQVPLERIV